MKTRTKYIHEGGYVAEVDIDLVESDDDWSPCLSVDDASKLDDIRDLLRAGNVQAAGRMARIFKLTPVPSRG